MKDIVNQHIKQGVHVTDLFSVLPYGGELKDNIISRQAQQILLQNHSIPRWCLTQRQLCDIELLLNGGFSPLEGFLSEKDYTTVLAESRLADGTLWPMPITLDVSEEFASKVSAGNEIGLENAEGVLIAILKITDKWQPDKLAEAKAVFGTTDSLHAGVNYLLNKSEPVYLGGKLLGLTLPPHYDFNHLRLTPAQLRNLFKNLGWSRIVGFQTRNPMHRAHLELTLRAAESENAHLLIHPSIGMTKPGDVDYYTRIKCYEKLLPYYPEGTALLSLLPLAMRMGGPREALWHAIIRQNYGCTHFIIGRDHAGPGKNSQGENFYTPYQAQEFVAQYAHELAIKIVTFQEMVYVQQTKTYMPVNEVKSEQTMLNVSGTELRRHLQEGREIPAWFSYPAVIEELRRSYPARENQGIALFFTGLSGAGKSTLAQALYAFLLEHTNKKITLLDGDLVRKMLSSELGFSREHRDLNILRIGYVASEVTKHGGIAICAPIAPYQATRAQVREMIAAQGNFIEIYLATSIAVCEQRDRKGLYARARAGLIKNFTGIDDPYEEPISPEIKIDTSQCNVKEALAVITAYLEKQGLIKSVSIQDKKTNEVVAI